MEATQTAMSKHDLVEQYGEIVSSLSRRFVYNQELARDAAQEVWVEILKSYSTFLGKSKLSTWIYTVARRVLHRYVKNEQYHSIAFMKKCSVDFVKPEMPAVSSDLLIWLKQFCDDCLTSILTCLDPDTRLAFLFRDVAELPYRDIAEIMENKEATIRKQISRARKKVNRFLRGECYLYNPEGTCRCKMRQEVLKFNLPDEFSKVRKITGQINLFREASLVYPRKNYWKKFL